MDALVAEAAHREAEVADYQRNIDRFRLMITLLPEGQWPSEIVMYSDPNVPVPAELDDAVEDMIADYRNRDMLTARIRSEKGQQRISALALSALKLQIGDGYDQLLAEFRHAQPKPA